MCYPALYGQATLLNSYLVQLLDNGFLHADPHPGNFLLQNDGTLCVLDFGLMTEVHLTYVESLSNAPR